MAWTLIGLLWLAGALSAGWRSRGPEERHLVGRLGVQNVAIQLFVVLPAVVGSSWRMLRAAPGDAGAAFLSNALVTAVALPLLSAVVLTFAAMLVAVPVSRLGARR